MENNYIVYMHKLKTDDRRYIGITCTKPIRRWGSNGNGYKRNTYFWRAIQKYGWVNFEHIILFEGLSRDQACAKEIALIKLFHTTEIQFGFNRSDGGTIMPLKPVRRAIPVDELKHLYIDLGWTRKQIAMYYGYCECSIAKKLGELGIVKLPKVEILYDNLCYQYITLDKSEIECALYFNCSRGVIQRYLNLYDIHRPPWRRKK